MREDSTGGRGQIFKDLKKSSGGTMSWRTQVRLKAEELAEKKTKVEVFEKYEFFQVWEEGVCKLRREHNSHQIGRRKKSGPLVSASREHQEERTGRTDLNRQI
jgi:hypothetical protein